MELLIVTVMHGELLSRAFTAMQMAAEDLEPYQRTGRHGFTMYEHFRPNIPDGKLGWGQAGELQLRKVLDFVPQ